MTAKALMPVRILDLVAPLDHKSTAMHTHGDRSLVASEPGAVTALIGSGLRRGDVVSATVALPGTRTSTTATRTTTTRAPSSALAPSADPDLFYQLAVAHSDCVRGKRSSLTVLEFEADLERNLCDLHDELLAGTYRPGRSICFPISRPKVREVWAARVRDRIVHHLLYNKIAARFHAAFAAGSSACIPGRGTLRAAERLEHNIRSITQNWSRPAFYLKLDLANFFVSIDKHVVFELLAKRISEPWWLDLAHLVLFHDPRGDVEVRGNRDLLRRVPPHKSLFNAPADTGLPIGNLSSQFFANVQLDALDQRCKHQLRARYYERYVDDFIMLHESPQWLNEAREDLEAWLPARLHLQINPSKTVLQPVHRGVDFVGHLIKPWRRITRPRTAVSALHRLHEASAEDLFELTNSYLGLHTQASHGHADRARVANIARRRGHCVAADLCKVYRRAANN